MKNFFTLDNSSTTRLFDVDELREHFRHSSSLENADVGGKKFGGAKSQEWKNVFNGRSFKNVRFSHATFERMTFKSCIFEDCLFIGTQFLECEFHLCKFINCNTYKFSLNAVYLDPACVFLDKAYKSTASNVGVDLFHELYRNAIEDRQDSFARYADIRMERWKRAQLRFDAKEHKITKIQYPIFWMRNFLSDILLGYGYGWFNFLVVGLCAFIGLALLMYQTWERLGLRVSGGGVVAPPEFFDMFYYSMLLITTLGFADLMPSTVYGRALAVVFAIGGITWGGVLTSLLVKRLIR